MPLYKTFSRLLTLMKIFSRILFPFFVCIFVSVCVSAHDIFSRFSGHGKEYIYMARYHIWLVFLESQCCRYLCWFSSLGQIACTRSLSLSSTFPFRILFPVLSLFLSSCVTINTSCLTRTELPLLMMKIMFTAWEI